MKISGQTNLTNLQDLKTTPKAKEETPFADNDKVTLSGSSDAGDVSFLKVFKGPSYTKEQALFDLTEAEASGDQAMGDLRIIEGNMKKNETLKEATDQFIRVLNYWGNGNTSEAQQHFTNIGNTLRQNEARKEAVDLYMDLGRAENDIAQGMSNYIFIDNYVDDKKPRKELTDQFINLLNFVGNSNTSEAKTYFSNIEKNLRPNEKRQDALQLYKDLAKAENDIAQGMSNYLFIDNYVDEKRPRKELTEQFINLLNFVGNGNTDEAKTYFSNIEKNLGVHEKRQEALELYKDLAKAENSIDQGMSNYLFIDNYVNDKKPRKEMTEQFINLLNFVGNGNTNETKTYFSNIEKTLRPDEKRQEALELYKDLAKAENDIAQGMSNYLFIDNYVTKEKTREELTAQFIRILDRVGNGNTNEAKKMFSQLNS